MRRVILLRALRGAPVGLLICHFITLVISLRHGNGTYLAVPQELIADWGGELNAVLIQTGLCLAYGAMWGGASVIWEIERWSPLRMTLTHLAVTAGSTLPVAWLLRWMPRSALGVGVYFAIFFGIYLCIWLGSYAKVKASIDRINRKM